MAAAASRVQRDLNEAWTDLDDDTDVHIDISEDNLGDSAGNFRASNESHRESENRSFRNTPSRGTECGSSRGGSTTTKRMRTARPCDVLGVSLDGVAEAMQKFGLGKEVNRTTKVLDLLEEVQGLTNPEFIEVGQLLTRDEKLASFFMGSRKYYVVVNGRRPGIYVSWDEARLHVEGYSGARHRSFKSLQDATAWWNSNHATTSSESMIQTCGEVESPTYASELIQGIPRSGVCKSTQTDDTPTNDGGTVAALLVAILVTFFILYIIIKL